MQTLKYLDTIYTKKNTGENISQDFQAYVDSLNIKRSPNAIKLMVYVGVYGTAYWRVFIPMMELAKNPDFDIRISIVLETKDIDWADIVYFQRCSNEVICREANIAHRLGKKVLFDTDDYIHNHPSYNPSKKAIEESPFLKQVDELLTYCDVMTASTDYLGSLYKTKVKKTVTLPNSYNKNHWIYEPTHHNSCINIAYGASNTHSKDAETCTQALVQIMEKYPNVRLMTVGWDGIDKIRQDKTFFYNDAFSGVPIEKRINYLWCDYPHRIIKYLKHADLGIAPLLENDFNKAKSNVKFIEYSLVNAPTVASDIDAYNYDRKNNPTILVKNNRFDKWYKSLEKLIVDKDYRENLGKLSNEYNEQNFNIENNIHLWVNLFKELMNDSTR